MTEKTTAIDTTGSLHQAPEKTSPPILPLASAVTEHIGSEVASFHTPGHKGRPAGASAGRFGTHTWQSDVTELPGLDELANPHGVLADLEARASRLWRSGKSIISVNGASAGIAAAIIACAQANRTSAGRNKILLPRNIHRSVINGLVISGLAPVWYNVGWSQAWEQWENAAPSAIESMLAEHHKELVGILVVSPTYGGAISNIAAIAERCHTYNLPLIVDEAHGAHFVPDSVMPPSAVTLGADLVVHSLHKTLSGWTQTGLVHVSAGSQIDHAHVRKAMNLLQSSSPSYLLMGSIEHAIEELEGEIGKANLARLRAFGAELHKFASNLEFIDVYTPAADQDPARLLIRSPRLSSQKVAEYLDAWGVLPETVLGKGVLLLLGMGTTEADREYLKSALADLANYLSQSPGTESSGRAQSFQPSNKVDQVLSPRQAFFAPSEVLPTARAVGRIAAETIAPCPPGLPLAIAGQRVPEELATVKSVSVVRVVVE